MVEYGGGIWWKNKVVEYGGKTQCGRKDIWGGQKESEEMKKKKKKKNYNHRLQEREE